MNRGDQLQAAQDDLRFVSKNEHKPDRERWVVAQWLLARSRFQAAVVPGADPPDFVVDGVGVEVVEAMPAGRCRGDEYREKVDAARRGHLGHRRLPTRRQVRDHGHEWVFLQIDGKCRKNYDAEAASQWTLLVYANVAYAEHIQWDELRQLVAEAAPALSAVDVVYSVAKGPVAHTVYEHPAS